MIWSRCPRKLHLKGEDVKEFQSNLKGFLAIILPKVPPGFGNLWILDRPSDRACLQIRGHIFKGTSSQWPQRLQRRLRLFVFIIGRLTGISEGKPWSFFSDGNFVCMILENKGSVCGQLCCWLGWTCNKYLSVDLCLLYLLWVILRCSSFDFARLLINLSVVFEPWWASKVVSSSLNYVCTQSLAQIWWTIWVVGSSVLWRQWD